MATNNFPAELRYTKDHEWARLEGGLVRVGITAHAVDQLGDITIVDLPKAGRKLASHEHFGDIESVKTTSELFSPIAGEVIEVNGELASQPEIVNESPYQRAWMLVIKPSDADPLSGLMDAVAYAAYVASL